MRPLRLLQGAALASAAGLVAAPGCTTEPIDAALRAMEQSGRVSFVCLGDPSHPSPMRELRACRNVQADEQDDFGGGGSDGSAGSTTGGGGSGGSTATGGSGGSTSSSGIPHLYALVTQTFRGEVAVVDLTTTGDNKLVDQDPAVPGPSFLPIGGQPTGIVSTPGGTATFVTVAQVGREGIFAIPSTRIVRPGGDEAAPSLSSWPSCSLPAAPGEPLLVNDPADADGNERARCDDPYDTPATGSANGDLTLEGRGRPKIVVPLPTLGMLAVVDAQALLDQADGTFEACPVDRWIALDSEVPPLSPPDPPAGAACVNEKQGGPAAVSGTPFPAGMAYAEGTLYVADQALPLIHRLAGDSPCEPVSLPPLLPFSAEDPSRVVTTTRVAITPTPTSKLQRFVYADDAGEGALMVFDVSDGSTSRTPLVRSHPEWTPLQPRDRIRFISAPRDIAVVTRDVPQEVPGTGVAPEGVLCSPDPALEDCVTENTTTCDTATLYRTADDYGSGAAPLKLRGTFGFVLLTNGQIEIIDVDDFDGACRVPAVLDPALGCEAVTCTKTTACPEPYGACPLTAEDAADAVAECPLPTIVRSTCTKSNKTCTAGGKCPSFDSTDDPDEKVQCTGDGVECPEGFAADAFTEQESSGAVHTCFPYTERSSREDSCNVVTPNSLRSAQYVVNDDNVGDNGPGLSAFPRLFDKNGAVLEEDDDTKGEFPRLRAPLFADGGKPVVAIQGELVSVDATGAPPGAENIVAVNLETPRAHASNQVWTVAFEGALPRFGTVAAQLQASLDGEPDPARPDGIYDSSSQFCDGGAQGVEAWRVQLAAEGVPAGDLDDEAEALADRVQITNVLLDEEDWYWEHGGAAEQCQVSFEICQQAFGDGDTPLPARDFLVTEAYQDRLLLRDSTITLKDAAGNVLLTRQALALAKCCFPTLINYVVRPGNQWTVTGSALPFLHHVVPDPETGACRTSCDPVKSRMNGRARRVPNGTVLHDGDPLVYVNPMLRFGVVDGTAPPLRDMAFQFSSTGQFTPLTITLLSGTIDIAPVGLTFIPPTGELAVTDGALQGLLTVSLADVATSRQFY